MGGRAAEQEYSGIIRRGAKLLHAYGEATVAKMMGASGAVGFVCRGRLKEAANEGEDVDALRLELQQDYEDTLVNPYIAAERGYVDAVIPPSHTTSWQRVTLLERTYMRR